jgi:hypothetical protein
MTSSTIKIVPGDLAANGYERTLSVATGLGRVLEVWVGDLPELDGPIVRVDAPSAGPIPDIAAWVRAEQEFLVWHAPSGERWLETLATVESDVLAEAHAAREALG